MNGAQAQTWWLTGASSGIGAAVAHRLAREGHRVYISARSLPALQALADEYPGQLIPLPCDVSDDVAMTGVFAGLPVDRRPAYLDGLIAAAGSCEYVDLPVLDVAMLRRVADVNYFGIANACKAALPLLQAAADAGRRPAIVGVCSMSVYTGFPRAEAYGSAKAAMRYFLESLRCDISPAIGVSIVYPGFVSTPMTAANDFPMPWCLSAEEAAERIVASLDKRPRSLAFPWQLHWVLRLAAWLPGLWYGVLAPRLSRQQRKAATTSASRSTSGDRSV